MIPRKSIDQVGPRQMRKRLMQAFNGCNNPRQYNNGNNRESINLVENISTLTR